MKTFLYAAALTLAVSLGQTASAEIVCTLVIDARTGAVIVEEGDCGTRVTPASTFKIPLAVMGYDAGFLTETTAPVLQFRAGDPDWGGANWTRDTDPVSWMRFSVLWYSQRITHALGAATLTGYAQSFGYGTADFSGDPGFDNGLERAWIASSLLISPREQAAFLRRLVVDDLPVRPEAMGLARAIVEHHDVGDWVIHGKTGTAYPRRADRSFDYARGWGWYVGWAAQDDRVLVFVRLTQARERMEGSPGNIARAVFLQDWPEMVAP